MNRILFGEGLPPLDSDVDEVGLDLERVGLPPHTIRRQDGGPGSAKAVEHNVTAPGTILHGVRHQRHRLDRRV